MGRMQFGRQEIAFDEGLNGIERNAGQERDVLEAGDEVGGCALDLDARAGGRRRGGQGGIEDGDVVVGIRKHPTPPHQLLDIRRQIVPRILIFNLGRPVILARADQHLLRIRRHSPVQRFRVIDWEALRHSGRRSAGA